MSRDAAKIGAVFILALFLITGGTAQAADTDSDTDAQILHLLNRVTFGPTPGDMAAVRSMGIEAYIQQQLRPAQIALPDNLVSRLNELPTLRTPLLQIAQQYELPAGGKKELLPDEKKEYEKRVHVITEELSEAKVLRAVASPAQLQEVMVDFWFNHFNVFAEKGADKVFTSSYERDAIRPYALGKFRDLLEATARHPAMLFYLDNWENTDPNSRFAQRVAMKQGKQIGINENYARELMELHTLGVNGGYTQGDVTTLAHILTGWGLSRGQGLLGKAQFEFDPNRHDWNNQIFLGRQFQGGGGEEIDRALDILAAHPSTARHIAFQLAQYFVADQPPQTLIDRLTVAFRKSDGDISYTLNVLFHTQEFWDQKVAQTKFKPPFRYVVSALRANGLMPPGDTRKIQGAIGQMGEPLYRCLTPNGYANTNDQWLNSDAILKRINVAKVLAQFTGVVQPKTIEDALGRTWSVNTLKTVSSAEPNLQAALLLGSPEFLYY